MAAPSGDAFDAWLSEKLQNINVDVDLEVFVTYIRGVLESETEEDDIDDAISGILGEIIENGLEGHCVDIRKHWQEMSKALTEEKAKKETLNIDQQLSSMMENTNVATVKPKQQSAEERARKAAILAQYAQVSDGEASDDERATGGGASGGDNQICNADAVVARERDMREKAKKESDEKKVKDKEDREKQKQKVTDRKEKEKLRTQKGERRR